MNTNKSIDQTVHKITLGKNVESLRIAANLTKESLAEKSGLTRSTIADVEKGTANPSLDVLFRLSAALGLTVSDLFSPSVVHQSAYIIQPTGGNLYSTLVAQLTSVQNGECDIHVAYAKSSGVDLLTSAFRAFRTAGGHLRILVGIDQKNTTSEAIYKLMILCDELYVVHDTAFAQTYHPKIYLVRNANQVWAAVGSNNLTSGGLWKNYETCHTQILDLSNTIDRNAYQNLTETFSIYRDSGLVKRITTKEDIYELLADGLIVTEQQSRQNATRRSSFGTHPHFSHRAVPNCPTFPSAKEKVAVPAELLASTLSNSEGAGNTSLHDSEITATSFHTLVVSNDVQETFWFEMRASTGGSRNILDLSSSARLQAGTHPLVEKGFIPGGVSFFGLDPADRSKTKDITVVYNGIAYYPSTVLFAPNNSSWRIQLKGNAETGNSSLSQFGREEFAHHILVFHRVTSHHYILETMAESELDALKAHSEYWATNGISRSSKAFGKIKISHR